VPETKPKPKKVGRPKLPKGEAKGKLVALRLSASDVKRVSAAAKAKKQTVSEWIRSTLEASLNG
jgi:predicted HicB family RNase H-like nuclease